MRDLCSQSKYQWRSGSISTCVLFLYISLKWFGFMNLSEIKLKTSELVYNRLKFKF